MAPGLYIHIPFCKTKCPYCDFYSVAATGLIERFINALLMEIDLCRDTFTRFDTVYLGGGTPSLLTPDQIGGILEKIRSSFTIGPDPEITMEVNPADLDKEGLRMLREEGINRISIGVQSFSDAELAFIGRRHTGRQAMDAIEDAVAAGFDNISVDLMYSLPGQAWRDWRNSLDQALQFRPDHLSCYELEIKDTTLLGRRMKAGELSEPGEESRRGFFIRTSEFLEDAGYTHYEISNFATGIQKASRHNSKYWDHTEYLGLGPSAHSFAGSKRWWNNPLIEDYLHSLEEGKPPVSGDENLTPDQLRMEEIFLALRTKKGIDVERIRARYGYDLMKEKSADLQRFAAAGCIKTEDGFVRPTRAGMALADSLELF